MEAGSFLTDVKSNYTVLFCKEGQRAEETLWCRNNLANTYVAFTKCYAGEVK